MTIKDRALSMLSAFIFCATILCMPTIKAKAADFSDKYELYEAWDSGLKEYTLDVSEQLDIPYSAIIAIIYHESRFLSDVGSTYKGLMQVGSTTDVLNFLRNCGMNLKGNDLYDPYVNILAGSYILDYAMDKSSSIEDAFYIYTCGEGNVRDRKNNGLSYNNATIEIIELYYDFEEYLSKQSEETEDTAKEQTEYSFLDFICGFYLDIIQFNDISALYAQNECNCIPVIGANKIELSNSCLVHKMTQYDHKISQKIFK